MRTTLSLDSDVAAQVEHIRRDKNISLKMVINEALRQGLRQMLSKPAKRNPFRTKTVSLGQCNVGSIADVADVLDLDNDGDQLT